jgi:hypothetical protein
LSCIHFDGDSYVNGRSLLQRQVNKFFAGCRRAASRVRQLKFSSTDVLPAIGHDRDHQVMADGQRPLRGGEKKS